MKLTLLTTTVFCGLFACLTVQAMDRDAGPRHNSRHVEVKRHRRSQSCGDPSSALDEHVQNKPQTSQLKSAQEDFENKRDDALCEPSCVQAAFLVMLTILRLC